MTPFIKGLKKGDLIGIIAPASPVTVEELQPAINIIQQAGYRVLEGDHLYDINGYLAGKDKERLKDIHKMFRNNDVKAILCARGGYGTPRLLDKIDYAVIKKNPKLFIGYSDITALLLAIHHKTKITVLHGPMLKGKEGLEDNLNNLLKLLSTEGRINYPLNENAVLKKGKSRGRLLGGNLSLISSILGTPFLPSLRGAILFLEDRGEPLYRIDRMLTHMKLAGALKGIKGLIVGHFLDCGDTDEINRLLLEKFSGDYPVYTGFPAGHGKENHLIPLGARAMLDTESLLLTVDGFISKG